MPSCPCSKKVAPEGMDDIVRDRKCTDILWLVFFVMFWIGMVVIGIIGLQNGDPKKLVYGKDYNSKVCSGETKYVYCRFPLKIFLVKYIYILSMWA